MDELKPTWRLAWGLFWRFFLISLGVYAVIGLIVFLIVLITGAAFLPSLLPGLGGG